MITGQIQQAVPQEVNRILQRRESARTIITFTMQSMCLKKTQTEAFIEFSALHPQDKVKQ